MAGKNLVELCASSLEAVEEAFRLGYAIVVFDQRVSGASVSKTMDLSALKSRFAAAKEKLYECPLDNIRERRLLSRVTIVSEGPRLDVPRPLMTFFDIIAVEVGDAAALAKACDDVNVDVVSLPVSTNNIFRAPVLSLQKRKACFELTYASTSLRRLVSLAARLCDLSRCKNIVFSSAARDAISQHAPRDARNLAICLGFQPMPHLVLQRAAQRRRATPLRADPRTLNLPALFEENIHKRKRTQQGVLHSYKEDKSRMNLIRNN